MKQIKITCPEGYEIDKGKGRKIDINDLIKMSYFSTPVEGITRNVNKS